MNKRYYSTKLTQYYFLDPENRRVNINDFHPSNMPSFYSVNCADGRILTIHYSRIKHETKETQDNSERQIEGGADTTEAPL